MSRRRFASGQCILRESFRPLQKHFSAPSVLSFVAIVAKRQLLSSSANRGITRKNIILRRSITSRAPNPPKKKTRGGTPARVEGLRGEFIFEETIGIAMSPEIHVRRKLSEKVRKNRKNNHFIHFIFFFYFFLLLFQTILASFGKTKKYLKLQINLTKKKIENPMKFFAKCFRRLLLFSGTKFDFGVRRKQAHLPPILRHPMYSSFDT